MLFYFNFYSSIALLSLVDVCSAQNDGCNAGFISVDGKECEACQTCPPGYGVLVVCNNTQDTKCVQCDEEHYSNSNSSVERCLACTVCLEGEVKSPCSSTQDTECECPENSFYCNGVCKPCNKTGTECKKDCEAALSTDKMTSEESVNKDGLPKVNTGVEVIFGALLALVLLAALLLLLYRFSGGFKKCVDTECSFCAGPTVLVTSQVRYKRYENEVSTKETSPDNRRRIERIKNFKHVPLSEMVLTAVSDKLALTEAQLRQFAVENGIQDSRFQELVRGVAYLNNRQYNVLHDWWMQNPHCMTSDLVEALEGVSGEAAIVAENALTTGSQPYQELQVQA